MSDDSKFEDSDSRPHTVDPSEGVGTETETIEQTTKEQQPVTDEVIRAWLVGKIAASLEVSESEVDLDAPLDSFGLDSLVLFSMTGELAEWLNCDLPATLLFEVPSINELSDILGTLVTSA